MANNISLDSSDDAINETPVTSAAVHPNMAYNIVMTDIEDGDSGGKISNIAPTNVQTLAKTFIIPKVRNDRRTRTEPRKRAPPSDDGANVTRMGNPRSRRPIVRGDYGRVSDLSFISNTTDNEQDPNDLVSDFHDSDDDLNELGAMNKNGPTVPMISN